MNTPLFQCTVNDGASEMLVCLQQTASYYAYGPVGDRPEIVFARHVHSIDMTPWPGIGSSIWEEVAFANGEFEYRIAHSFDKTEKDRTYGALNISRNGLQFAELICDPGTLDARDFYPLFEAKEASGQCWNFEA